MSFIDDMSDTARKVFLAGVGAVAMSAEKSSQLIDDLVKKGEITVEQGKALNEELKHKASTVSSDTEASILRGRMRVMTPEEREAYAAKVSQIKDDLNAEPVEVDAEPVEEAEDVEPEAADEPKDDAE
jgi:polyhydroxyalkanoate synthesis regulator phasin